MGTIVLGKLESGIVCKGQTLTLMPNKVLMLFFVNMLLNVESYDIEVLQSAADTGTDSCRCHFTHRLWLHLADVMFNELVIYF